ncbi:hypothetical protein [Fodinicurvata fenggangensis]|uniref:hypothetical protein n=1 Tax=Fodinicurvata fenggangensis TaxID=1121830 RepID=UPI00047ED08B|nr:hypothetical protein [Fodinicurvata fenggangensis]
MPAFEAGFQAIDRRKMHQARLRQLIETSSLPQLSIQKTRTERVAYMLAEIFGLTLRQQEVSALLLARHTTASISRTLGVNYNTARRHCEAILQKCAIRRREQRAILAHENVRG